MKQMAKQEKLTSQVPDDEHEVSGPEQDLACQQNVSHVSHLVLGDRTSCTHSMVYLDA